MTSFVDPRTNPQPPAASSRQLAANQKEVADLVQLRKDGRLYDVERWIKAVGIELPKPKRKRPSTVHIGTWGTNSRELRFDRAALFQLAWSKPVMKLAEEWGISGRGLGKALRGLKVPVPPRGYWARLEAGQRPRRPKLPKLKPGEAEEIVVWVPDP